MIEDKDEIQSTQNIDNWMTDAIKKARKDGRNKLAPDLFLKTMLDQTFNVTVLNMIDDVNLVHLDKVIQDAPTTSPSDFGEYDNTIEDGSPISELFSIAKTVQKETDSDHMSSYHLLIALTRYRTFEKLFELFEITEKKILSVIPSTNKEVSSFHSSSEGSQTFSSNSKTEYIDKFGIDLTAKADAGEIDPIIGRDHETRLVVTMLSRRNKNNPILVGEPGTGKTSIIEGIAQRIVDGNVPANLKGKRVVSLNLTSLVAGAKARGEFESRLKKIISEIKETNGSVILFIDEIHSIVDNGAADVLKPILARGEISLVGSTTTEEYRKNIEKDPALERRFQKINVAEPTVDETVAILRGLVGKYENFHQVVISDDALVSAAKLSDRYVTGRCLPDKAIDVVDESATRLRMELNSSPDEVYSAQSKVDRFKIKEAALRKNPNFNDEDTSDSFDEFLDKKAEAEDNLIALRSRWENEQKMRNLISSLRSEKNDLKKQAEDFVKDNNFEEASKIQYETIPEVEEKIENTLLANKNIVPLVADHVGQDEVASVVGSWTGIPVGKLLAGESQKLVHMEAELGKDVIGQSEAISAVSTAVRRSRAGVNDPKRPTGSFMFLGASGTGKTHLAKSLAQFLFDDEDAMVRIDMSEFSEKHSVARLVGAPPGYVGYESGGQLTEAVRSRPYSVVLLDEVEKAHSEIFDILLQVLDDGRLTDGQGITVDFRNTIIVLTSNLGSQALVNDNLTEEEKREFVFEAVNNNFRPEFLNRLDEKVIFNSLTKDELSHIANLQVSEFAKRLSERKIDFKVSDKAIDWLSDNGYEPAFGARPLRRLIQKQIGDQLSMLIIDGTVKNNDTVKVVVDEKVNELELIVE